MPDRRSCGERPERPPPEWGSAAFADDGELFRELRRVFDICHGCRRCATLCPAFSTLFELIDDSCTMGLDGVERRDYWRVVELCHLCDQCYASRCPFIPPHERRVDFPLLMLRARVVGFRSGRTTLRDRLLASTDRIRRLTSVPLLGKLARLGANSRIMHGVLHLNPGARILPRWRSSGRRAVAGAETAGVLLFATCSGDHGIPDPRSDLCAILEHNAIPVTLLHRERCCGMPRMQLGDLEGVEQARHANIPQMAQWVERGWSILTTEPSCLQLFRNWLPLLFPDDGQVRTVAAAIFEPFEYLRMLHREGRLNTSFRERLGVVNCHLPCRARGHGAVTEILELVPGTHVELLPGCGGCAGGYALKEELNHVAGQLVEPMVRRIRQVMPDHYGSLCPSFGRRIERGLADGSRAEHPLTLLRLAYGI